MRASATLRACESFRGLPVGAAHGHEESLLLEVLFEHVKGFTQQVGTRLEHPRALEHLQNERRVTQRDGADGEGDRGPRRVAGRRALLYQIGGRIFASGDCERAQRGRRGSHQFLEADRRNTET